MMVYKPRTNYTYLQTADREQLFILCQSSKWGSTGQPVYDGQKLSPRGNLEAESKGQIKKGLQNSTDLRPIGDHFFTCPECQNPIPWLRERTYIERDCSGCQSASFLC